MLRWLNRSQRRTLQAAGGVSYAGRFFPWEEISKHLLFMGGTGSGKTFASNLLIKALMKSGCPMLFTCVKDDDFARIEALAREIGHASRLVEITPTSRWRMNLLDSLLQPAGSVELAAQLLSRIGEVGKRAGGSGLENAAFWKTQAERAMRSAITLCRAVEGKATIPDVHAVIMTSPSKPDEHRLHPMWNPKFAHDEHGNPVPRTRCAELVVRGLRERCDSAAFNNATAYLLMELAGGGDEMRGGVMAEVNNTLGYFIDSPWIEAFSGATTMHPALIEAHGLIAVLNYPTSVHFTPARLWQFAWTMEAQRWCLRRDKDRVRLPFILVRDEVGWILNPEWDALTCLVSRSQKLAHIDLVQDVSTLLMALGGQAEAEAYSFLANHAGAKLLFGSGDMTTNKWMSSLLGEHKEIIFSGGTGNRHQPTGDLCDDILGVGSDYHWQETYRPVCPPEEFARLGVGQAVMAAGGTFERVDFWQGRK